MCYYFPIFKIRKLGSERFWNLSKVTQWLPYLAFVPSFPLAAKWHLTISQHWTAFEFTQEGEQPCFVLLPDFHSTASEPLTAIPLTLATTLQYRHPEVVVKQKRAETSPWGEGGTSGDSMPTLWGLGRRPDFWPVTRPKCPECMRQQVSRKDLAGGTRTPDQDLLVISPHTPFRPSLASQSPVQSTQCRICSWVSLRDSSRARLLKNMGCPEWRTLQLSLDPSSPTPGVTAPAWTPAKCPPAPSEAKWPKTKRPWDEMTPMMQMESS